MDVAPRSMKWLHIPSPIVVHFFSSESPLPHARPLVFLDRNSANAPIHAIAASRPCPLEVADDLKSIRMYHSCASPPPKPRIQAGVGLPRPIRVLDTTGLRLPMVASSSQCAEEMVLCPTMGLSSMNVMCQRRRKHTSLQPHPVRPMEEATPHYCHFLFWTLNNLL